MPTIGRSRIYFWTLFVIVLLQLPTGYATNMPMLLVFRFLTGFFGRPVLATGGATIFTHGWVCGTCEGLAVDDLGARVDLYRRARRLRRTTGGSRFHTQADIGTANVNLRDHLVVLSRAFTMAFTEPVVFFVDLYCVLLYGILYIWFESFPIVFGDIYGFNTGQQGLVFLGIFVGGLITLPCYLLWICKVAIPRFAHPPVKPEVILPPTFFSAVTLPICLFWYAWTARPEIHLIVPLVGSDSFTISIITLFMPVLSYLGMAYPQYAASVLAGNARFRASCGVVFPLFARALFRNLGIGPGNSLLGGLSILFIPIPFILFYFGERVRHRSWAATHET